MLLFPINITTLIILHAVLYITIFCIYSLLHEGSLEEGQYFIEHKIPRMLKITPEVLDHYEHHVWCTCKQCEKRILWKISNEKDVPNRVNTCITEDLHVLFNKNICKFFRGIEPIYAQLWDFKNLYERHVRYTSDIQEAKKFIDLSSAKFLIDRGNWVILSVKRNHKEIGVNTYNNGGNRSLDETIEKSCLICFYYNEEKDYCSRMEQRPENVADGVCLNFKYRKERI